MNGTSEIGENVFYHSHIRENVEEWREQRFLKQKELKRKLKETFIFMGDEW